MKLLRTRTAVLQLFLNHCPALNWDFLAELIHLSGFHCSSEREREKEEGEKNFS